MSGKEKLEAIRRASEHTFPTADIEQMLEEIKRGYTGGALDTSESER